MDDAGVGEADVAEVFVRSIVREGGKTKESGCGVAGRIDLGNWKIW